MDFLGDSVVKNLLAIEEMRVQSLGREDTLEKEMVTLSSILGKSYGQRRLAGFSQSMGVTKELDKT